jgi:hypothetical protein
VYAKPGGNWPSEHTMRAITPGSIAYSMGQMCRTASFFKSRKPPFSRRKLQFQMPMSRSRRKSDCVFCFEEVRARGAIGRRLEVRADAGSR